MRLLTQVLIISTLVGCVHLNSVSLTQIPKKRDNEVKVEASKMIFIGLSFDNDFVDQASDQLRDKCKGGEVRGILTKDEYVNYFLGLVVKRRVVARGFCEAGKGNA